MSYFFPETLHLSAIMTHFQNNIRSVFLQFRQAKKTTCNQKCEKLVYSVNDNPQSKPYILN